MGLTAAEIGELMQGLEVVREPIGRLTEFKGNAKVHTAEQVEQIKASMREFGMIDPIGVWTNAEGKSEVVEGHGRLMAALELGLEEVPVIHLDGLTDEQRRAYALVHNKLTMSTGWDFSKLDAALEELAEMDMGEFGFDTIESAEQEEDFGEVSLKEEIFIKIKCESDSQAESLYEEMIERGFVCQLSTL